MSQISTALLLVVIDIYIYILRQSRVSPGNKKGQIAIFLNSWF